MSSPHIADHVDAGAAVTVGLALAGLSHENDAASSLGLSPSEFRSLLGELGLAGTAMIPVAMDDALATYYADLGSNAFDSPFFDDLVESHRAIGTNALVYRLPADAVLAAATRPAGRGPDGLIFHVGRCGSTLLCNLLASVGRWVALREPEFLNKLLGRLAAEPDRDAKHRLGVLIAQSLRSLAHGVRLDRDAGERRCVVKFSSWNAMLAREVVARLEATPLIAVTRDPCATVASFLRDPPHWNPELPSPEDRLGSVRFFAEAWLGAIDAMLQLPSERTLFVDYDDLITAPSTVLLAVCRHLGDTRANANITAAENILKVYSKGTRGEQFQPEGRHRLHCLDEAERKLVATITADSRSALAAHIRRAGRREPRLGPMKTERRGSRDQAPG
jgi:hypothetical protein